MYRRFEPKKIDNNSTRVRTVSSLLSLSLSLSLSLFLSTKKIVSSLSFPYRKEIRILLTVAQRLSMAPIKRKTALSVACRIRKAVDCIWHLCHALEYPVDMPGQIGNWYSARGCRDGQTDLRRSTSGLKHGHRQQFSRTRGPPDEADPRGSVKLGQIASRRSPRTGILTTGKRGAYVAKRSFF